MIYTLIEGIEIAGLSACVPSKVYDNSTYKWISSKEREKFIRVTGIRFRHIADKKLTASTMALHAAKKLIDDLNINSKNIGILIFVSQSRDYYLPQTAALLHRELGLSSDAFVTDISLGCSGYVYGLATAASLLKKTNSSYALLLVADISTRTTPYTDKTTFPLFGDAAAATLLRKNSDAPPIYFTYGTDGDHYEAIIIRHGMFKHGVSPKSFKMKHIAPGIYRHKLHLELDGSQIMHFSITTVVESIKKFFQQLNINQQEVDFFIFHQANKIILETIAKILKIPLQKVPINYDRFGNTSVASIPLCLVTELSRVLNTEQNKLFLSAFGVGLSWGNALIQTDRIHISEISYI